MPKAIEIITLASLSIIISSVSVGLGVGYTVAVAIKEIAAVYWGSPFYIYGSRTTQMETNNYYYYRNVYKYYDIESRVGTPKVTHYKLVYGGN